MEEHSLSPTRKCPKCDSEDISRSRRRGIIEKTVSLLGFVPYRCNNYYCRKRFFLLTPKKTSEMVPEENTSD